MTIRHSQKQAEPFPASQQGGRGRALLLQALLLAEQDEKRKHGLTLAAGYTLLQGDKTDKTDETDEADETEQAKRQRERDALAKQGATAPPGNADLASELSPPSMFDPDQHSENMRANFWGISERQQLLPSPRVDEEQAKLPLALEQLVYTGGQSSVEPPDSATPPIVHSARLLPAARRNLSSKRQAGLDIAKLTADLCQAKPLRRLPRKNILGWASRVLMVLDISKPLGLYREDVFALVAQFQRWIGANKVQVRIIAEENYPAGPWLDGVNQTLQPQAPDWRYLGSAWSILFITELGLYADDGGQTKHAWADLLRMLRRQGAALQVWCPLPLGEAVREDRQTEQTEETEEIAQAEENSAKRILPAVPVVHWSAASRMRQQPLSKVELHRSAARLELAETFCCLLASASYIEPQLVRRMRSLLGAPGLDAGLEQLLWQHAALSKHEHARCLRPAYLDAYRQGFAALPASQQRQALHVMHGLHMQHNPLLAHVEALTWAAQVGAQVYQAEHAPAAKELVDTAQTVIAQLAYQPWQLQELKPADILSFMHGFVYRTDQRTRQFCSASMGKMLALLKQNNGNRDGDGDGDGDGNGNVNHDSQTIRDSLPGIREADLAQAFGPVQQALPYWLGIDKENGWLRLFAKAPAEQFLLAKEALLLSSVAIEMAGKVRWEIVQPGRDIALARLPWGAENAQKGSSDDNNHAYAPFAPPLAEGPIYLEAGNQRLTIEEIQRPSWALEWGQDREGVYALMPDPWSAAYKTYFPAWLSGEPIYSKAIPAKNAKKVGVAKLLQCQLAYDEIGPFAQFTIQAANGEHSQTLRYIPAGQFLMGSPASEARRAENEGPQHQVRISRGFWLADTACTQGLWQAIMGKNPSYFHETKHGSPMHPVENIDWYDVQEFLEKLAKLLPDCQPSLPTEAEWEYACRAGSTTPFSFGATISTEQVNYRGDAYGLGQEGEFRDHTVAVKELPANQWGLYQMHGNVWEWCADAPREYSVDAVLDPGLGADLGGKGLRVLRGGSWRSSAQGARSAYRNHFRPDWRFNFIGFRFALRSSR